LKKQWIPDHARNDKNTNMRSFANCDTVCLRLVVDFRKSAMAKVLTQANQIKNTKIVSYNRARDMPQVKMFKIS